MATSLFVMQIPILEKILRTVLVYALIIILFRLTGKRGLAGLNTFDFVVIFLLSSRSAQRWARRARGRRGARSPTGPARA